MRKGSRAVRFRAEGDAVENCREIKRLQEDVMVATRNVKQLKEQVSQLERQIKTMLLDSNKKHETLLGRFDSLSAQMYHTMAISKQQQPQQQPQPQPQPQQQQQQQQQQEEIRTKTKMQISFVNTKGETRSLVVKSIDAIDKVKLEIAEMEGIPAEDQRLIFQGWELENGKTLADYHITDNASIHLVQRFRGRYL